MFISTRTTPGSPDIDNNGILDIVQTYYHVDGTTLLPERNLISMLQGIPYLRMRIQNNRKYSYSSVQEIFGPQFSQAEHLNANTLSLMLFINRGSSFDGKLLPDEAQFAPGFHVGVSDYDGDGHEDVFLSQNFFAYHVGTPRSDGGRGLWLKGDGTGVLTPVAGQETGI